MHFLCQQCESYNEAHRDTITAQKPCLLCLAGWGVGVNLLLIHLVVLQVLQQTIIVKDWEVVPVGGAANKYHVMLDRGHKQLAGEAD